MKKSYKPVGYERVPGEKKYDHKKDEETSIWKSLCALLVVTMLLVISILACATYACNLRKVYAAGQDTGYIYIEQTEDEDVIRFTEEIGSRYGICPELLQAMVFYESSNDPKVKSAGRDTGYMQVNPKWHRERMDKLGVTDLTDGYSNILVGTDYLAELAEEYEDISLVLMKYNGDSKADKLYKQGEMSEYAEKILSLSAELERLHGK